MQAPYYNLSETPKVVKVIIWITSIVTLASPLLSYLFARYLDVAGPAFWLSLSTEGIKMGWIWQIITYLFLQSPSTSYSLSLFFSLFFNMLLFWFAAKEVVVRYGPLTLLGLYLGGGLFAGLIALLAMTLFSLPTPLFGAGPALFALLVGWSTLHKELDLALIFLWRLGARFLVTLLLVLTLLTQLIHQEWIPLIATVSGSLYGYLYSLIAFKPPKIRRREKKRNVEEEIEVEVISIKKD